MSISALDTKHELCAKCFHAKENHLNIDGTPKCVCNGSLQCMCDTFVEPFLERFAQRIEQEKKTRKDVKKRCEYILEEIPQTRNAGEKTFAKIYKEIWHGVKIRKHAENSTAVTTGLYEQIPHDDTINREKRRLKQHNDGLKTYSPQVLREQSAIYQTMMELATIDD